MENDTYYKALEDWKNEQEEWFKKIGCKPKKYTSSKTIIHIPKVSKTNKN